MAGTKEGGLKAAAKNLQNNPNFYREIGKKGGANGHTGGFASMPKELVSMYGRKGGLKSSRAGVKNTKKSEKDVEKALDEVVVKVETNQPMKIRKGVLGRIFGTR